MSRAGLLLLGVIVLLAVFAPWVAPNDPRTFFANRVYAPPTRVHVHDAQGWHVPFIYRQVQVSRVELLFQDDPATRVPLRWFQGGRLVSADASGGPLLLFGADNLGRDVFSRLLFGARLSLGVTALGASGALLLGAFFGALAGVAGGLVETALMWSADFMLVLPAVYLLLVLRALMPLRLDWTTTFALMAVLFAATGWPRVARGVRGIVVTERTREYAQAARAIGAGPLRLMRHLAPAATGFLLVELILLVPAMLVAEATLSFLGVGFPPSDPSWGSMLHDLEEITLLGMAPWLLAPAVALFVVVLALQLVLGSRGDRDVLRAASRS